MTKASDNAFPSILITEGTEPSAPAAGKQRLYIDSTTHLLKATNSSGTDRTIEGVPAGAVTTSGLTMATARLLGRTTASTGAVEEITVGSGLSLSAGSLTATGSGSIGAFDTKRYTGGDIALTSTSQAAVSGPTDLVVAAATGDILLVGLAVSPVTNTAASIAFEFATMVAGSPVNYIGARSGTPINIPVQMWLIGSAETSGCGGMYPYTVQAGDISGGNVTLRLYARVSANRSINADASNPLDTWVKNVLH